MEATFVVRPEELREQLLNQLEQLFSDDNRPVTVTVKRDDKPRYDAQAVLKQMAETRSTYPTKTIPADVDINKLIDEMYWEGNH